MPRSVALWIGKTDDTPAPPRVRLRVWDRCVGKCHRCNRDIPTGDAWILGTLNKPYDLLAFRDCDDILD